MSKQAAPGPATREPEQTGEQRRAVTPSERPAPFGSAQQRGAVRAAKILRRHADLMRLTYDAILVWRWDGHGRRPTARAVESSSYDRAAGPAWWTVDPYRRDFESRLGCARRCR
jgi:hypothetical protein